MKIQPNNIKEVLFKYVQNPKTWFFWYHNPRRLHDLYENDPHHDNRYKPISGFTEIVWRYGESAPLEIDGDKVHIQKDLYDFFSATLDETRIKSANAFAEYALYISDAADLTYFRDSVAKRELTGEVDYNSQRDHAAHTVYNYILGWYFFDNSKELREAFKTYFDKKLEIIDLEKPTKEELDHNGTDRQKYCKIDKNIFETSIVLVNEFGDVWPFASLLHDIGYILEGSLSSASTEVEHTRIINGSKIIHDYFNHYFWKFYKIDFRVTKHIAKTLGVMVPDFKRSESLGSLGDHLCDIGSCENIRDQYKEDRKSKTYLYNLMKSISNPYGLNSEAFAIWKDYYENYGNNNMKNILCIVETVYRNNLWVGADYGKRSLDHGVCSGLISLQALTFFRELFLGFKKKTHSDLLEDQEKLKKSEHIPYNLVSEEIFEFIKKEVLHVPLRIKIRGEFRADDWFNKVCWATASAAIHSIIQLPEYQKECPKHIGDDKDETFFRLALDDDPLAFLGLLVDLLQEWDRYKVKQRGVSAFSGSVPLQSNFIILDGDMETSHIILQYPRDLEATSNLKTGITNCLKIADVNKIVQIMKYNHKGTQISLFP
ncbi:MAG: hypothetical protein EPN17_04365 [Methylobacter sp.]|nr:MAG: hypothetical protein EPN17_04365 [Methylobacter sp.]